MTTLPCRARKPGLAVPFGAALLLACASPTFADGTAPSTDGCSDETVAAEEEIAPSGMTVYVDRKTGGFSSVPTPGSTPLRISPELRNALSTSHRGLVQRKSTVPGGGYVLDHRGRFQSAMVAVLGEDGKPRIACVSSIAGAPAPAEAAPEECR